MTSKPAKLTDDQRRMVEDTVLAVLHNALEALRFHDLDARVRAKLHEQLGGWNYRYTDAACQRMRRAGRIISARQRWRPAAAVVAPKEVQP
jgi:hypothetical protein